VEGAVVGTDVPVRGTRARRVAGTVGTEVEALVDAGVVVDVGVDARAFARPAGARLLASEWRDRSTARVLRS